MANTLSNTAKATALTTGLNLTGVNCRLVLLSSAYTYSSAHDFLDDLSGTIATSAVLTNVAVSSAGIVDADDATFTSVTGTPTQAWLYIDSGTAATSRLIVYYDTVTGFGSALSGIGLTLRFNASGIFAL